MTEGTLSPPYHLKVNHLSKKKKEKDCPLYCGISQEKCLLGLYVLKYPSRLWTSNRQISPRKLTK